MFGVRASTRKEYLKEPFQNICQTHPATRKTFQNFKNTKDCFDWNKIGDLALLNIARGATNLDQQNRDIFNPAVIALV